MSGWWDRATNAERLAQIDGGIELGMMPRHVAWNLGVRYLTLVQFAHKHGRKFAYTVRGVYHDRRAARVRPVQVSRAAYFSGEPVDFWGAA